MELKVKTEHNGKGFVLNRSKVIEIFKHFQNQEIDLSVRKWSNNRTARQNRALHGWCTAIADHTGDSPEDVKGELKRKYLEKIIYDADGEPKLDEHGEIRTKIVGTSELTIEEFSDFQARVMDVAKFLGVELIAYEE